MTTEIEKQFFDTFRIEHEERYYNCKENLEGKCGIKCPCECCDKSEEVYCYPQITDRHYLELICVLSKLIDEKYGEYKTFISFDCENLKEEILEECLLHREELKNQVQAIFEGEGWN